MPSSRSRSLREMVLGTARRRNISPPSPTLSEATNASAMNLGPRGPRKIITRSNLKSSIQALEDLVDTCANYRAALAAMSRATAAFADAMERCSGLKGPSYEASARLQAASGIHHLIGNQWHVLVEALDKNFEKPVRQHLEAYRAVVMERSVAYERALREKSQIIHDTETRNLIGKERNLQTFREALAILQRQVDELDELKVVHYQEIVDHEEQAWDVVQGKVCIVVRSTMDVFDRFTAKALDPIIEPMLQSVPDPFNSYGPPQSEDQIFSILAPLSIMSNVQPSTPSPRTTPSPNPARPLPVSSAGGATAWSSTENSAVMPTESAEWAYPPPLPISSQTSSASATPTQLHTNLSGGEESDTGFQIQNVLSIIDVAHQRPQISPTNEESCMDDVARRADSFGQEWTFTDSCVHLTGAQRSGEYLSSPSPDIDINAEPASQPSIS